MEEKQLKIGLFYYTGTGSTKFFANFIKQHLEAQGHEVSSYRIKSTSVENWGKFQVIGVGAPTWVWRAPRVLTNRLKDKGFTNKPYFTFITCGGSPGNTEWSIYKSLRNKGNTYLGSIVGNGPNNIRRWRPKLTQPDPVEQNSVHEQDLEHSTEFLQNLIQKLITTPITNWNTLAASKPSKSVFFSFLGAISTYRWEMQGFVGKKYINEEKCTRCGLCAEKICPSNAITLDPTQFPMIDESSCWGCMGCINLCPTLAIETRSSRKKHPFTTYRKNILGN